MVSVWRDEEEGGFGDVMRGLSARAMVISILIAVASARAADGDRC